MKRIAVAGNPNSGKTCLFNSITGSRQRVGNYAGVTVEYVKGYAEVDGEKMEFIDLPGTYSLTAYSDEERVARDYILNEQPDAILVVLDAANLERNLYFAIQLIELGRPVIFALNMVDVAEKKGLTIDHQKLGELMGVPVIPTIAVKRQGLQELLHGCAELTKNPHQPKSLFYGYELHEQLTDLAKTVGTMPSLAELGPSLWVTLKLLEEDPAVLKVYQGLTDSSQLTAALEKTAHYIKLHTGEEPLTAVVEARHAIATGAVHQTQKRTVTDRQLKTEEIDRVVCHRFLGPALLVGVVYLLFDLTFRLADGIPYLFNGSDWVTPVGFLEWLFENLNTWVSGLTENYPLLQSLLCDGIIGGVGGILGFTPLIFFMFIFIAILEDSGYIARVAFILDRLLRVFGLQGKSILALIAAGGFSAGCAVPGIMATRTLREEKDRLVTILVTPLMNCGAKLPVYLMLIAAFFPGNKTLMLMGLWAVSWIVALGAAWVLRKFVIKGEQTPFVMELPVYHRPSVQGVLSHAWHLTWLYMKKAGTVILAISVILWALMYFPRHEVEPGTEVAESVQNSEQLQNSYAGRFGRTLEPISEFAGFNWKDNIALIGGWAAKEVVLGTYGTIYAMEPEAAEDGDSLGVVLKNDGWTVGKALALMIFVMVYAPCVATLGAIKQETGSWKWTIFATVYTTTLGYILAVVVFQTAQLLA